MLSSLGDGPDAHRHLGPAASGAPGSPARTQAGEQAGDVRLLSAIGRTPGPPLGGPGVVLAGDPAGGARPRYSKP
ncbi:hypothetical protein ACFWM1_25535 [Nocardia sp. NPDC058379]|uniref:hypothetical protein n=1 Tax=unclassified Nocardia TaxID=2637762 RepID=UPI00366297C5